MIDMSLKRYQAMEPPRFHEDELFEWLSSEVDAGRDVPSLREIRDRFGGGFRRIIRIRREFMLEKLGISHPEFERRQTDAVDRLERVTDALGSVITDALAPSRHRNVIPFPGASSTAGSQTRSELASDASRSLLHRVAEEQAVLKARITEVAKAQWTPAEIAAAVTAALDKKPRLQKFESPTVSMLKDTVDDAFLVVGKRLGEIDFKLAQIWNRDDLAGDRLHLAADRLESIAVTQDRAMTSAPEAFVSTVLSKLEEIRPSEIAVSVEGPSAADIANSVSTALQEAVAETSGAIRAVESIIRQESERGAQESSEQRQTQRRIEAMLETRFLRLEESQSALHSAFEESAHRRLQAEDSLRKQYVSLGARVTQSYRRPLLLSKESVADLHLAIRAATKLGADSVVRRLRASAEPRLGRNPLTKSSKKKPRSTKARLNHDRRRKPKLRATAKSRAKR